MSARNGQRARFHRNRKRRVVQRMNRSGFIGGLYLREDGANVPTKQVCPGAA